MVGLIFMAIVLSLLLISIFSGPANPGDEYGPF
jgi:hypothetical protein